MDLSFARQGFVFESLVMLFQVIGLGGLVLSRLIPSNRWTGQGTRVFIIALVGLGMAGAICSHHHSSMGLIAGGTLTFLLVGMIAGNHPASPVVKRATSDVIGPTAAF